METKVSFAIVGAFVVVLAAAGVAAVLWLGSGQVARRESDLYVTFFRGSVSGLNVHAIVKYRGVDVGDVRDIALDPADPTRVRVLLGVDHGTPVKTDTFATLETQGLTGLAYVELEGGSNESPPLRREPGVGYPVIASVPFRRLDIEAVAILDEVGQISRKVNALLDDETRAALRGVILDLRTVSQTLSRRSGDIDAAIGDAARAAHGAARAGAALPGVVERLGRAADGLEAMSGEIARAGAEARGAAAEARGGVRRLDGELLPEVQRLVLELRDATGTLARVSRELERSPGALVQGRAVAPGPGE